MQCKVCNAFIPEGYMYCPVCGEEIIIVSDFEIKLEDNIDVAALVQTAEIPDVTKELEAKPDVTKDFSGISAKVREKHKKPVKETPKKKINTAAVVFFAVIGLFVIGGIIFGTVEVSRYFSYDYQYELAQRLYDGGDYRQAVSTSKHLVSLGNDEKGKILLADCYIAEHNYDAAIAVLYDALNDYPNDITLYDRIVDCYKSENNSSGIHELINNSKDSTLALRYSDYVSISPTFSLESGSYIEPDPIKLSAPGDGRIYYTVDGSVPTEDSLSYMGPIPLETGKTVISAIYINEKGIVSDVVSNTYEVEPDVPDPPELLVESGNITTPQLIGVTAPEDCRVYYTDNGSVPTSSSSEYTSPFLMPIGKSTYTFICINSNGLESEPVSGTYNLNMNVAIAKDMAEYAISYQLMSTGEVIFGKTYKAEYGYSDGGRIYYVINEYSGSSATGRMFAVDTISGELYRFSKEDKKCTRF
ncbi:MAG: chitobiase/beta-hexosaminidase C-terminal domain-containing protein [Lachnospiraceae bacterium]|nr:chitobiase/beta-hexosaminidase C-terminal domain-containing protein [Lachnospiraceae bacterium]